MHGQQNVKYIYINIYNLFVCKPLYMFRVVSPPIIRSSCHCIHCISRRERDWTGPVTFTTGCSYGFTNNRCCIYSDMSSRWWVEIPPETCRAVYRHKLTVYCCILLDNYSQYSYQLYRSHISWQTHKLSATAYAQEAIKLSHLTWCV